MTHLVYAPCVYVESILLHMCYLAIFGGIEDVTVSARVGSTLSIPVFAPWSVASSNPLIATAAIAAGLLTIEAIAPGSVTITLTQPGQTLTIVVTVTT